LKLAKIVREPDKKTLEPAASWEPDLAG
jgi:hypothetical protein